MKSLFFNGLFFKLMLLIGSSSSDSKPIPNTENIYNQSLEDCSCSEYLYVNEVQNGGRVHKFKVNEDGSLLEVNPDNAWYPNGGVSELPSPHGLGTDLNGYLYIGSTAGGGGKVRKLDCDGNIFSIDDFEIPNIGTHNIYSIGNTLYVKRADNGVLESFDLCEGTKTGEVCLDAGGGVNGYNGWPLHIDKDEQFYGAIHYHMNGSIYKFASSDFDNGCIQPFITGVKDNSGFGNSEIYGITTDLDGNIYVVLAGSYPGPAMIRKYNAMGNHVGDTAIDWSDNDGVGWYGAIGISYSESCNCLYTANGTTNNDCVSSFDLDLNYTGAAVGPVGDANGLNAYASFNKAIGIVTECCPQFESMDVEEEVCVESGSNGPVGDYFLIDFLPCEFICAGEWSVLSNTAGTFNSCNNSFTYEQAGEACFSYSYNPSPTNLNALCEAFDINVCLTFNELAAEIDKTDACDGQDDGSVDVTVSGGAEPLSYSWSHDAQESSSMLTDLAAGDYSVTISDDNGCETIETITIQTGECECAVTFTEALISSCNGGSFDSAITLSWEGAPTTGGLEYKVNDGPWQLLIPGRVNMSSSATEEMMDIIGLMCEDTKKLSIRFEDAPDCYHDVGFVFQPGDPGGWIYCEENGEIVEGGTISVTPPAGGSVMITSDGSNGEYYWLATGSPLVMGLYTMTYTHPSGYTITGTPGLLPGDTDDIMDPTLGSEDNPLNQDPVNLGSDTIVGATHLIDFSPMANPYFLDFELEINDPFVFLNNIPLTGCVIYDGGDLPDLSFTTQRGDYQTDTINNGPFHRIIDGLYMGTPPDDESDGQQSMDALGDGDDEDCTEILATYNIAPNGTLRLPLDVTNTTSEVAYLEIWVDWNADGDFDEPNELVMDVDDSSNPGTFPSLLTLSIPDDVVVDEDLGMRLRLSHTDDMSPYGRVDSGEVEDYLLMATCKRNICLPIAIIKK